MEDIKSDKDNGLTPSSQTTKKSAFWNILIGLNLIGLLLLTIFINRNLHSSEIHPAQTRFDSNTTAKIKILEEQISLLKLQQSRSDTKSVNHFEPQWLTHLNWARLAALLQQANIQWTQFSNPSHTIEALEQAKHWAQNMQAPHGWQEEINALSQNLKQQKISSKQKIHADLHQLGRIFINWHRQHTIPTPSSTSIHNDKPQNLKQKINKELSY